MSTPSNRSRREVLQSAAITAAGVALGQSPALANAADPTATLPTRPFGRTGREVCMLAHGTGEIAHRKVPFDEVVDVIAHGIDSGITYIDTAVTYDAEEHVGKAIAGRRKGLFIATKTVERTYDGAMKQLEQSLKRLGTDHLNLWQVHSIGHNGATGDQELARLRDPNGVLKAMRKAKEEKIIDHFGFTGHTNPDFMLAVLADESLTFDTMLFTISAAMTGGNRDGWEGKVLPAGRKRNLGLIAMKIFGGGNAVGVGEKKATPAELLHYIWDLGLPVANVGLYTKDQVDAAVAACKSYKPKPAKSDAKPTDAEKKTPGGGPTPSAAWTTRDELRARLNGIALPFERMGYLDGRFA